MAEITIYYQSDEPCKGKNIYKECNIFKQNGLPFPESTKDIRDEDSSKLRKIIYFFPLKTSFPGESKLKRIFEEIINKCDMNIKRIESVNQYGQEYDIKVEK